MKKLLLLTMLSTFLKTLAIHEEELVMLRSMAKGVRISPGQSREYQRRSIDIKVTQDNTGILTTRVYPHEKK